MNDGENDTSAADDNRPEEAAPDQERPAERPPEGTPAEEPGADAGEDASADQGAGSDDTGLTGESFAGDEDREVEDEDMDEELVEAVELVEIDDLVSAVERRGRVQEALMFLNLPVQAQRAIKALLWLNHENEDRAAAAIKQGREVDEKVVQPLYGPMQDKNGDVILDEDRNPVIGLHPGVRERAQGQTPGPEAEEAYLSLQIAAAGRVVRSFAEPETDDEIEEEDDQDGDKPVLAPA